jgi:hypothetical protein
MRPLVAAAVLIGAVGPLGAAAQQRPRWAAFEGIGLGGPVDDIMTKNGECWPGDAAGEMPPGMTVFAFAYTAFGYALPHGHTPRDSTAIRRALGVGTMCRAPLGGEVRALAAAVDRRVVAVVVYFLSDSVGAIPVDSVRRRVYAAWGRPTHHAPTLDTWSGPRYRSYLLAPQRPPGMPAWARSVQLVLLDITACTAFDRRVHRAGAPGEAGTC